MYSSGIWGIATSNWLRTDQFKLYIADRTTQKERSASWDHPVLRITMSKPFLLVEATTCTGVMFDPTRDEEYTPTSGLRCR